MVTNIPTVLSRTFLSVSALTSSSILTRTMFWVGVSGRGPTVIRQHSASRFVRGKSAGRKRLHTDTGALISGTAAYSSARCRHRKSSKHPGTVRLPPGRTVPAAAHRSRTLAVKVPERSPLGRRGRPVLTSPVPSTRARTIPGSRVSISISSLFFIWCGCSRF